MQRRPRGMRRVRGRSGPRNARRTDPPQKRHGGEARCSKKPASPPALPLHPLLSLQQTIPAPQAKDLRQAPGLLNLRSYRAWQEGCGGQQRRLLVRGGDLSSRLHGMPPCPSIMPSREGVNPRNEMRVYVPRLAPPSARGRIVKPVEVVLSRSCLLNTLPRSGPLP